MTAPTSSFLDFFVLEAGEYVEQLDALLLRADAVAMDADGLQRTARALRGSATMARLPMFAEVASMLETVGRSLKQGSLGYDPALKAALTAAVDDLRILLRAARTWSAVEDQLAMKRVGELAALAGVAPPSAAAGAAPSATANYFAAEADAIAGSLDRLAASPADRTAAMDALNRVRALRGVAGVREVPALAEVSEAAEQATRPAEVGDAPLPADNVGVLRAAADLLRAIAAGIAAGQSVTTATPQYRAYLTALDAMLANEAGADQVIPIAELFYHDAGPHVVSQSSRPPTTPAQRFRLEVVSLGEHLHRVIDEARQATDDIQREHARGGLGRALRAIRATAASFGQTAVARSVEGHLARTGDLTAAALDAISAFAASISPAAIAPTPAIQPAVGLRMTAVRGAVAALGATVPTTASPAPMRVPMPPAGAQPAMASPATAPSAAAPPPPRISAPVAATLDASIAAFEAIAMERLAEPVQIGEDLVPVDALFYRGPAALDRAIELRDELRRAGGSPAPEVLEEIYDLLDLARVN